MKIPIRITCSNCKRDQYVSVHLNELRFEATCECGKDLSGVLAGFTTGDKLIRRSLFEYHDNSDYALCVVFAAMAMECELSRLFIKWSRIDSLGGSWPTDHELEGSLRKFSNIAARIDEVARLMYPAGFTSFVQSQTEIKQMIIDGFNRLDVNDLPSSFQKQLFWPRNRILHLGDAMIKEGEARYCFNTATLGLRILDLLDQHRRAAG